MLARYMLCMVLCPHVSVTSLYSIKIAKLTITENNASPTLKPFLGEIFSPIENGAQNDTKLTMHAAW